MGVAWWSAVPAGGATIDRTTSLISAPIGVADPDTADAFFERVSADGSRVFFSTSQKLTADDLDTNRTDSYQRAGGVTSLLSKPTDVADPDGDVSFASASADGTRVFVSFDTQLSNAGATSTAPPRFGGVPDESF